MPETVHMSMEDKYAAGGRFPRHAWIILLCVFHLLLLFWWLGKDTSSVLGDEARHLAISLKIQDALRHPNRQTLNEILYRAYIYPPFYYIATQPAYLPGFRSHTAAVFFTNGLFLMLALWGIYGIGSRLHDRRTGLLAACVTGGYPLFLKFTHNYYNDFALVGLSIFSIWLLLESRRFESRRHCIILGFVCLMGLLTKWTFFLFVSGAFLWEIAELLMTMRKEHTASGKKGILPFLRDRRLINLLLCLAIAASLSAPWYLSQSSLVMKHFKSTQESTRVFHQSDNLLSVGNIVRLPLSFDRHLSTPWFVVFLAMTALGFVKWRRQTIRILFWMLPAFIFFTAIHSKSEKHTMSFMPLMALLSVAPVMEWLRHSPAGRIKYTGVCIGALGIISTLVFSAFSPGRYNLNPVTDDDWKVDSFLRSVYDDMEQRNTNRATLFIGNTLDRTHHVVFDYYNTVQSPPERRLSVIQINLEMNPFLQLADADYFFSKTGDLFPPMTRPGPEKAAIYEKTRQALFSQNQEENVLFEVVRSIPLPDQTTGSILRVIPEKPAIQAALLKMALKDDPKDPYNIIKAAELVKPHDLQAAARLYLQALDILKKRVEEDEKTWDLIQISQIYSLFERWDEAEATLERILKREPKHTHSLIAMGEIQAAKKNPDKAVEFLKKAIATAPNHAYTYRRLSEILISCGRNAEARAILTEGLVITPGDYNLQLRLGQMSFNEKDYAGAAKHLEKAAKLNPNDAAPLFYLALSYMEIGDKEKAREMKNRVIPMTQNKDYLDTLNRLIP